MDVFAAPHTYKEKSGILSFKSCGTSEPVAKIWYELRHYFLLSLLEKKNSLTNFQTMYEMSLVIHFLPCLCDCLQSLRFVKYK